jgi:hypothetical protein
MRNVRLDICCNDPANGIFDGRAAAIQLADLELAASDMRGPKMRDEGGEIIIAGKHFAYDRCKEWFGNWCWNAYWMPLERAVDFLLWARRRGFWDVEQGEERIFNLWKHPDPTLLSGSRDFLERWFGKPPTWDGHRA